jgi:hypothetical protein
MPDHPLNKIHDIYIHVLPSFGRGAEVVRARDFGDYGPQRAHGPTEACRSPGVAPFFAGISQSNSSARDLKNGTLSQSVIS